MDIAPRKLVVALIVSLLLIASPICEAKRAVSGSNRKSSSNSGYSTRRQPNTSVTKPTYNTNSGSSGNSHADAAKLSYPNYNSQPNRPASAPAPNSQDIGWKAPNQGNAGPPPAYSPSNVAGGAKTNMHEPPPVYQKPNYGAAPPSYNQATGTHYGAGTGTNYGAAPGTNYGAAPQYHNPGAVPAGATYHSPNNLPPGATYYNNPPPHMSGGYGGAGAYPAAGGYSNGYHPAGGMPAGGSYYPPSQSMPQGATYVPAGNALPPGAVYYSSPPQQTSSGLGFGSGLAAGAIGGAILGHVLTPTQTKVVEQAPAPAAAAAAAAAGADGGHDRIIIINNGQPVNATDVNGATVINTGATAEAGDTPAALASMAPVPAGDTPPMLAPMAPVPAGTSDMNVSQNATNPGVEMPAAPVPAAANPNPEQPPPGGIICVPVRVNDTDPNDATKMIEVEKIACYPAPPPPPPAEATNLNANSTTPAAAASAEGSAPLAAMEPITPGSSSQQLQQESTMVGDQSLKSADNSAGFKEGSLLAFITCFIVKYLINYN